MNGPAPDTAALDAAFWERLRRDPYGHDLFAALRWIDARSPGRLPLGRAALPREEPVRLRQEPSLAFAPATLASVSDADGRPAISVYSFGLYGPNGPLPLHMTEYVRERAIHHQDRTLQAFSDVFHHRLILLFYRAWADAQSTASLDRPDSRFTRYVASLVHLGLPSLRRRDDVADHAKFFMAGHLVRDTRNPEGLARILSHYFGIAVRIREFVPAWLRLDASQRLSLRGSRNGGGLGRDTTLGVAVLDAQHKFRIELGPMPLAQYRAFLPGRKKARQLVDWVRQYIGLELAWDVRLVLRRTDVAPARLDGECALGLGTWLGKRDPALGDADDLCIDLERRAAA
ncbi:MAG: type VI secretion system baseplate subunit TssG [Pigmentiphaga sp.]|uniref:type VI secretion system baseplate subunit TssG n=1 Tax=Pigmentiphaga sp. TaxID=1977564 RepID=UPI0029B095F0|nr:type VI secretion system baseplate subunit TssG [Pigmentiphaga sp.]MDX3905804.1 type VI secretion system baseplate subunit TssG [Pigmentiphaga sp.]